MGFAGTTMRFCGGAWRSGLALAMLANAACSTLSPVAQVIGVAPEPKPGELLTGYIGGAAADEPNAALAARDVLARGGNAADAATALGFMLAVTLPSRAGLGAFGACLAYRPGSDSPGRGVPEVISFPPIPGGAAGDRPAAVPMLARGLYLLSARYGSRPVAEMMAPAEQAARLGHHVSRALARDVALVAGPLAGDAQAAALFTPNGQPISEGMTLIQSDLGASLAQIRTVGVGDMYQGLLAQTLAERSAAVGGGLTAGELRAALPKVVDARIDTRGADQVALLPDTATQPRGAAAYPASTGFVVVDRKGGAVACSLSMGNLFGTGRIVPGTGILLGASPAAKPMPLLAAAIAYNSNLAAFRAAVSASGQAAAPAALEATLSAALGGDAAPQGPEPGRANVAACGRYLPGDPGSCRIASDPRGFGLASGS